MADKYRKELVASLEVAKKYREKVNPENRPLSDKDAEYIRAKVTNRVKAELMTWISRGYKNINLAFIDKLVDEALRTTGVAGGRTKQ